jgi:hypothetical protein
MFETLNQKPAIIPGNAPKQLNSSDNGCTQHHCQRKCMRLDDNSSDDQSIRTYPLSEDNRETGEVIESPSIKLPSKKHITPTSVTAVDTISSVRSCTLLKILFDPG